ncbi:hypothetical protein [Mesorhizobium sp.]|uniref:hypothetical protein n=1 Tax=Mesorhizobium sp. TaxID=1871066 RepID=UPI000FE50069|nr:hypothetical protein [Mesorhizobium sp.]RWE64078.1 MAG: hypothetical protein EOS42_32855 [Mesorhizobium sp.]TIV24784.1 MAG: hypothetical protein E5V90_29875 [Mesorhizobium sp.]
MERRKVSTVHADFIHELDSLLRLDAQNQRRYRPGPGRPGPATLSKHQMVLMTESVFIKAFSHYELFLEELFILYTRNKPTRGGTRVPSFILPKDGEHAREILKSGMQFLEWNSPDIIIRRCEVYLHDGDPIKRSVTTHSARLQRMKAIRNAIAHRSAEAAQKYNNVVRSELRAAPLQPLLPGEFLLSTDPSAPASYFLVSYLNIFRSVANVAAG